MRTLFRFFLAVWPYHLAIAAVLTIPIAAFTPRAGWKRWELLAFILPFSIFAGAASLRDHGNALQAVATLTLAIPVAALIRARLGAYPEAHRLVGVVGLGALCVLSLGLYLFLPARAF
jgi:hypothetical protein